MTENRRIFWNIIATYGRSLYSLAVGLITARWAFNALGVTDYGLYGVVGGLVAFISFLNSTLAGANSRFYAISIGKAKTAEDKKLALEDCRRWFNTALSIHTAVPAVLVIIGYPIGIWAIENFLKIPSDRVTDCIWVFRFTCLSCFVGMMNVPFAAMYTAKQYIAELTIYSYTTTTVNALFLYYMITHPGVWLVRYALWCCLLSVVPQVIICLRAMMVFPECRVKLSYLWDRGRIREVSAFAGWNFFGSLFQLLGTQGMNVLVNWGYGVVANAALSITNAVNAHATSLSGALVGAFSPAITTAYGAREHERMRVMAFRSCRMATLLAYVFIIPLMCELPLILKIWLKDPPPYTAGICMMFLFTYCMNMSTIGHINAINATGHVKEYQKSFAKVSMFNFPIKVLVCVLGFGIYAVVGMRVVFWLTIVWRRLYFARKEAGMNYRHWFYHVFLPLSFVGGLALLLGQTPKVLMAGTFWRVALSSLIIEVVIFVSAWSFVLERTEKEIVVEKAKSLRRRLLKR